LIPPAATPSNGGSSSASKASEAAVVKGLHWVWGGAAAQGAPTTPALLSVTQGGTARLHAAPAAGGSGAWEQLREWQVPPDVCCTVSAALRTAAHIKRPHSGTAMGVWMHLGLACCLLCFFSCLAGQGKSAAGCFSGAHSDHPP
jgi:hypothetical protein